MAQSPWLPWRIVPPQVKARHDPDQFKPIIAAVGAALRRIRAERDLGAWQEPTRVLAFHCSMESPMPELVRLYIQSVALGFAIAAGFTAGIVWLDVAGIGHLVMASDIGWIAAVMLVVFNGIVFSAVQFAFRIMAMAEDDGGSQGGRGAREPVLVPVVVPAKGGQHVRR
jgi:hypothetical protein